MKSILLIGLGRFGRHIAQELNELGHQVMAVDSNEDRVNAVLSYVTNAQIGDSTSEYFLRSLGVGNFDVCIVTIGGNFQSSLETTSLLKELGAKLVVSRAERDVQAKFLLRNGADEVVYPEKQLAKWAAIRYSSEHILDYIELQDDASGSNGRRRSHPTAAGCRSGPSVPLPSAPSRRNSRHCCYVPPPKSPRRPSCGSYIVFRSRMPMRSARSDDARAVICSA